MPHDDGPEVLAAVPDGKPYGKSTRKIKYFSTYLCHHLSIEEVIPFIFGHLPPSKVNPNFRELFMG